MNAEHLKLKAPGSTWTPNVQHLTAASDAALPSLRLGVIGCEFGRARYGPALSSLPSLQVVGLTDPDERYARIWARGLGNRTPVYADTLDLLEQPPDALLVAAPLSERAERIADVLRAGRPVLAEMPFAIDLRVIDDLIGLAAQNDVLLMPVAPRRFDPYFQAVAFQIEAGAIGSVQQVRYAWSFPLENVEPTTDYITGGWNGVMQALGCQTLDLSRWWQGRGDTVSADMDMEELSAAPIPGHRRPQERTLATLLIKHDCGHSTHQISRVRAIRPDERYIVTGSEGNMELVVSAGAAAATNSGPILHRQHAGQRAEPLLPDLSSHEAALNPATLRMQRLLLHFERCVRSQIAPTVTGADARAATELLHAAYISTQEKLRVSLPLHRSPNIAGLLSAVHAGRIKQLEA